MRGKTKWFLKLETEDNPDMIPLTGYSLSLRCHGHQPLAEGLMHRPDLTGNTSADSKSSSEWLNSISFSGVLFLKDPHGNNTKPKLSISFTMSIHHNQLNDSP